jgi:non-specific serine/threonine protein kinase
VIAYKLVVKNTVEEKIPELQERKKSLVRELVTTERGFYNSLSKEDLEALFEA